ncbi:hypothetical protein TWF481_007331 [Arthrobotrys musiformis]|uniref:Uncharacterized protein n=1 Tax=Arthrobotrys musiformis TaxID=47236 RepID=A0AAV9WB46_9PEZI
MSDMSMAIDEEKGSLSKLPDFDWENTAPGDEVPESVAVIEGVSAVELAKLLRDREGAAKDTGGKIKVGKIKMGKIKVGKTQAGA